MPYSHELIICLLLLFVISISRGYYYTKDRLTQKHLLPYPDCSNKLKGIAIDNTI